MISQLVAALTAVVDEAPAVPDIDRVRRGLRDPQRVPTSGGYNSTIAEQINAAVAHAANELDHALARAIRDAAPQLSWTSAYLDHDEPDIVAFHQGYFVSPIMGPSRLTGSIIETDTASLYLTIQAPQIDYPSHVHKAPELYHVVAGQGLWQKGDGPYEPQPAGSWIVHPTGTRHAMVTKDQPMLSLAMWTADLNSTPVIVRN